MVHISTLQGFLENVIHLVNAWSGLNPCGCRLRIKGFGQQGFRVLASGFGF